MGVQCLNELAGFLLESHGLNGVLMMLYCTAVGERVGGRSRALYTHCLRIMGVTQFCGVSHIEHISEKETFNFSDSCIMAIKLANKDPYAFG